MKLTRLTFQKARDAVLLREVAKTEYLIQLAAKYGLNVQRTWLGTAEKKKLDSLTAAHEKARERMFELLKETPRDWSRGIPSAWVTEKLTYEDAIKPANVPLSVEPPKSYGY